MNLIELIKMKIKWLLLVLTCCDFGSALSNTDLQYENTAAVTFSKMDEDFESVMGTDVQTTSGPFLLGEALHMNTSVNNQCFRKTPFASMWEKCLNDFLQCNDGYTIAVWFKPMFSTELSGENSYLADDENEYEYVISTGGSTTGTPGLYVAIQGHYLITVVSTGTMYSKISANGLLHSGSWNHIALVINKTEPPLLYINGTKSGEGIFLPINGDQSVPLFPSEMIVGCQKYINGSYGNYLTGDVVALSIWKHVETNTDILTGGSIEVSNFSVEATIDDLINGDLWDPAQFSETISHLSDVLSNQIIPTEQLDVTDKGLEDFVCFNLRTKEENLKNFNLSVTLVYDLMDVNKLSKTLRKTQVSNYDKTIELVSNLVDPKYAKHWESLDKLGGIKIMNFIEQSQKYTSHIVIAILETANELYHTAIISTP